MYSIGWCRRILSSFSSVVSKGVGSVAVVGIGFIVMLLSSLSCFLGFNLLTKFFISDKNYTCKYSSKKFYGKESSNSGVPSKGKNNFSIFGKRL